MKTMDRFLAVVVRVYIYGPLMQDHLCMRNLRSYGLKSTEFSCCPERASLAPEHGVRVSQEPGTKPSPNKVITIYKNVTRPDENGDSPDGNGENRSRRISVQEEDPRIRQPRLSLRTGQTVSIPCSNEI